MTTAAANTAVSTSDRRSGDGPSPASERNWLSTLSPLQWIATAVIGGAFGALFFRWIWKQHRMSSTQIEDWGHAYLIPVISLYVVWTMRDRLAKLRPVVFWPGLAPTMLGMMAYFCCIVVISNHMLQGLSLILTLFGVTLTLLGPFVMRVLFLPIAFLVFSVTISEAIMIKITFPLQLLAAQGAYITLDIVGGIAGLFGSGFGAEVEGNILTVIDGQGAAIPLNVAEACSGMRMVIAFVALAGMVALLGAQSWWQRAAVMLISAPVAVAMNVVRVAVLGLASLVNPELAAGDAHTLIGTLLLVPALLVFMGAVWAMEKLVREESPSEAEL